MGSFLRTPSIEMNVCYIVLAVTWHLGSATEDRSKYVPSENNSKSSYGVTKNNVASHHNITYIEKDENMLRLPNINNYYEEHKAKKKIKKSPKSTIQKIIKKNHSKLRKIYFSQKTSKTTAPPKIDYEKLYGQDEKMWKDDMTTTQVNQRRKPRKWSPRVARYPMPFQKLQPMKDKRYKRGLSRELYILKDLDEIEFLSKEDGNDVVKAHVKNYW